MECKSVPVQMKLVGRAAVGGNHGLELPELPAGWWKDTMYSMPTPYNPNFLSPVQSAISKETVKGWIETLLKSVRVSILFPKSWIRPWECICLFSPCHQPAFG